MVTFTAVSPHTNKAGGFPIMTLPLGFLMKDVLFLVASFYLLKAGSDACGAGDNTELRLIVGRHPCRRGDRINTASVALHMSAHGTKRTSGDVRLESAKWAKADIDQVCCGVVSNVCCDVSALTRLVLKASATPLPPLKPAIALNVQPKRRSAGLRRRLSGISFSSGISLSSGGQIGGSVRRSIRLSGNTSMPETEPKMILPLYERTRELFRCAP